MPEHEKEKALRHTGSFLMESFQVEPNLRSQNAEADIEKQGETIVLETSRESHIGEASRSFHPTCGITWVFNQSPT